MENFPFKNFSLTIPSSFTDFYNFISLIFLFSFIAIFAFTAKINQYFPLVDPFPWLFSLISPLQKILLYGSSMEIPQLDCSSPISILSLQHTFSPLEGISQHERLGLSDKKLITQSRQ